MTRSRDLPGDELDHAGAASGGRGSQIPEGEAQSESAAQLTAQRLPWWRFLAVAAGASAVTTVALVFVSVQLTPPCGGPWCLTGLLYFPISAIGASVVSLAISWLARRGYLLGLLAGVAGYGAAWLFLLEGGRLRFIA